ncbi:MAG TPA: EF-P lysine aminoacylase EpmA [bacterium]|nr:EF-P lysine aminoacylase EpmA [bacterium]
MHQPNWHRLKTDPQLRHKLEKRAQIVRAIREYFWSQDFIETETPTLVHVPGMEPYLDPFKTELRDEGGKRADAYLITSPEYAMKKLLAGGMERIFQLTRSYRNRETLSTQHSPEFTILEWYRANATYEDIMRDTEELVAYIARKVLGTTHVQYQGKPLELAPPWKRTSFAAALEQYAGVRYDEIETQAKLQALLRKRSYRVSDTDDWDTLVLQLFVQEVEPKLGQEQPEIIFDYPASQAALATISPRDARFAQRFEVYARGIELCNAFNELTDAAEQRRRLEEERKLRQQLGKDDYPVDETFLAALETGMPPAGGNALGVDRLAMLLLDTDRMADIVWCPWFEMFDLS